MLYYFITGLQLYKRVQENAWNVIVQNTNLQINLILYGDWTTRYEQQRMMFMKKDALDVDDF